MNRIQLRFGQAVGMKELVATLVVSGVLLIVGTVVFAKVKAATGSNADPDLCYQQTNNTACFDNYVESTHENQTVSGDAGTAIANVETTTYDAFETTLEKFGRGFSGAKTCDSCFDCPRCGCDNWNFNKSVWRLNEFHVAYVA